jgi:hypothetical protein
MTSAIGSYRTGIRIKDKDPLKKSGVPDPGTAACSGGKEAFIAVWKSNPSAAQAFFGGHTL